MTQRKQKEAEKAPLADNLSTVRTGHFTGVTASCLLVQRQGEQLWSWMKWHRRKSMKISSSFTSLPSSTWLQNCWDCMKICRNNVRLLMCSYVCLQSSVVSCTLYRTTAAYWISKVQSGTWQTFTQYQTAIDLPQANRVDIQWHMIGKTQDTPGNYKYKHLSRVIAAILAIPHSNADCEWVFSLVRNTHMEARSTMSNETLESLRIQKVTVVHHGTCHSQQFSTEMLQKA